MELAREVLRLYKELLRVIDHARTKGYDKYDFFEKLLLALDGLSMTISRMRARGILDPEVEKEFEKTLLERVSK